ncbi:MAG TPA: DUF6600 domain-containing protein [Polyangiaceae bacterium]|nr:DUF6600 domain-containing protein [Polyangiaceae bacterium]
MKPAILSLAAALFLAPAIVGCAGEDAEAGDAAYPPVGYTPPPTTPAPPPAPPSSPPPAPRSPAFHQPSVQLGAEQAPGEGPDEDGQVDGPQEEGSPSDAPPAAGAWQWGSPDDGAGAAASGGDPNADPGGGYADTDPSALTDFRSTLEPYGSWVDDPTYGTVWVPSPSVVGSDFTPYVSGGHWAYDSDYAWVSDYDWGWAPFHYGRWAHGPGFGWEWIPGREYAGAWVSWRYGVDDWSYVGWAPLAPTWCWRGGVAVGLGFVPRAPYAFVGTGELFAPAVGARVIAGPQVGVVASHTRPFVPSSSPGSRVAARPAVGGPSPTDLHIAPESVTRAAVDNRGLAQARAFSRPATAVALGARAPAGVAARSAPGAFSRGGDPVAAYRGPASPSSSHFGGRRLGGGFAGSPAASAPMRSYPAYSGSPRPYYGSAPAAMRTPYGARPYSAPTAIRSAPAAGAFRSAPPGGAFRSAPAAGAFRSAAPSGGAFRSSPAASSFHGSGASGGFHGGGGGHASGHR